MNPDLNDIDVPQNLLDSRAHESQAQDEMTKIIEKNIKDQYEKFDNLGQNILNLFINELPDSEKIQIFKNFIFYVHNKILPITDFDNLDGNNERLLIAGQYIYEFICVDNFASLIPALMEILNITSVDELDYIINTVYLSTPNKFKIDFLQVINTTIEQLMKLQNITPIVKQDKNYQKLLGKYFYYQELIENTDISMFLENYVRPVLAKYATDFIWKLL